MKDYSNLYVYPNGIYYAMHPNTGKKGSLETRDKATAIKIYRKLMLRWEDEREKRIADKFLERIEAMEVFKSSGDNIFLCDYIKNWRENVLGYIKNENGKLQINKTKALIMRGKKAGNLIRERTQIDYGRQCIQLENSEDCKFSINDKNIIKRLRNLLTPWLDQPTHYNHLLAVLSRVFDYAVKSALIDRNPVRDVDDLPTTSRKVYIPAEHYIAITDKLLIHRHNKRDMDGEWRVKIIDFMYALSQRPIDVFALSEDNIDNEKREIRFTHSKTDEPQIIECNDWLWEIISWFRQFKRSQQILSKHLMVYPRYFEMRSRAKPVTHRTMQEYWRIAVEEAAEENPDIKKGMYQLRDLRKRGLTDERVNQGRNEKGGHTNQRQAEEYELIKPPKRAKSTLVSIR